MKIGSTIIIIGFVGSGKTPTTKEFLKKSGLKKVYIYDPRDEYTFSDEYKIYKYHESKAFIDKIKTRKKSFIIFEEATSALSSAKNLNIQELFIAIEHNNNISVCIFHSLIDCPKSLLRLSQFIVLYPTSDDENEIKQNRRKYLPYFYESIEKNKGKKAEDWYKPVIIKQR